MIATTGQSAILGGRIAAPRMRVSFGYVRMMDKMSRSRWTSHLEHVRTRWCECISEAYGRTRLLQAVSSIGCCDRAVYFHPWTFHDNMTEVLLQSTGWCLIEMKLV